MEGEHHPFGESVPEGAFLEILERVALRLQEIAFEDGLHLASERLVIDGDVEFLVDLRRSCIKVRGTEHGKYPVDNHGFEVDHRWLIFVDLYSSPQQFAVGGASGRLGRRLVVVPAWEQEPDVDAALDRSDERSGLAAAGRAVALVM
jgi:hypothetical protein